MLRGTNDLTSSMGRDPIANMSNQVLSSSSVLFLEVNVGEERSSVCVSTLRAWSEILNETEDLEVVVAIPGQYITPYDNSQE